MATGDKPPTSHRSAMMTSQQQPQSQPATLAQHAFNRRGRHETHIINNKSTSPPIERRRFFARQQVRHESHLNNSRLMSGPIHNRTSGGADVGDLLRLTNLKLSDDGDNNKRTPNYYQRDPSSSDQRQTRNQLRPKMLMDRVELHQLQQQQQQQQHHHPSDSSSSHLTVIVNDTSGAPAQVSYAEHYFIPSADHHQAQDHQATYYASSGVGDATSFAQPASVYTTLDELHVFGGEHEEFNISHSHLNNNHNNNHNHNHHHHHHHHHNQQQHAHLSQHNHLCPQHQQHNVNLQDQRQQDEPPLEFLELDSRPPYDGTDPQNNAPSAAHAEIDSSSHFKLSSCGTYLEPAAPANELSHHHNLSGSVKTEPRMEEPPIFPESVIRLNENRPAHEDDDDDDDEQDDNLNRLHYHSSQSSYKNSQKSSATRSKQTAAAAAARAQPVEPANEFRVCEWENCGNTFDDMQQFVKHLEEKHVNQNPREKNRYFCLWSNCKRNEQEFNARYKLLIHMRVHSGEKPYPCSNEDCKKTFSRLENLKIHQRSHTGEKPYKCSYENCSKSFTNSSDRIKHHKTHKDPRPYCCSQLGCAKRYTDPSSLRKHLRAHKKVIGSSGAPTGGPMQTSSAAPNAYQQQQQQHHEQLTASYHHHQPSTIIEASYDPCEMLYESYGQSMAYSEPEATYPAEPQQLTYDKQQQQVRRTDGAQQIHHQHEPQQTATTTTTVQHYRQPAPQQQRYLSASVSQSHSQFSRSWCAGSTQSRAGPNRWLAGPLNGGSATPQVQASLSSSSLNSTASHYSNAQSYGYNQQQGPQVQNTADFLQPMSALLTGETREQQHQSLMRSLPAQPARQHHAPLSSRRIAAADTFAHSSVSLQHPQHGYQQQQSDTWYATTTPTPTPTNPNRYEPHG